MTDQDQIVKRMRRKVEIVRMDSKARGDATYHDMNELLTLLDMLERVHGKGVTSGDA